MESEKLGDDDDDDNDDDVHFPLKRHVSMTV